MPWNFIKLFVSKPLVTLRLLSFRRVRNAIVALTARPGNLDQLYRRYRNIYLAGTTDAVLTAPPGATYAGDIVIFPVIDWHFRFQRPQHLALALARAGYRVIYLSPTPLIADRSASYVVQESPAPGVFLIQLASGSRRLPDLHRDEASHEEVLATRQSLQALFADFSIRSPIALLQHPYWFPVVRGLPWSRLGYDCIDDHAAFCEQGAEALVTMEMGLINAADVVVASSAALAARIEAMRPCVLIRNGCDFHHFSSEPRVVSGGRPVIGYVGAIAEWFDIDLLADTARLAPQWNFVLVGSTAGADTSLARKLKNITWMGEVPYTDVPSLVASFDVCLIPFKITPLTLATNPVKVYEYLASGRPVVATALPELIALADFDVFTATTPIGFVEQIDRALSCADAPDRIAVRQEWARNQDWSLRGQDLISCLVDDASGRSVQSAA
jgi:glycosyltransferase involved in cell wall biosynthesis